MCGIAGIARSDASAVDGRLLVRMTRSLAHRGPDGEGFYTSSGVGLGHRRLAIIDLSDAGTQPMSNEDGTVWVAFNGEIYNFRDLRRDLEQRGHRFHSRTDTEVLVHLYEEYGADLVQHLRGMFAFAIWDDKRKSLLLARDRIGIKPLFYWIKAGELRFASEIKALTIDPAVSSEIDPLALDAFFAQRYVAAPSTMLTSVRQLEPGEVAEFGPKGVLVRRRYWQPTYDVDRSSRDWERELEACLRDSVKSHLVADVPYGALLSSGVDASVLLSLVAAEHSGRSISFTADFEDESFSEGKQARRMAEALKAENHQTLVSAPTVDELRTIVHHAEEPLGDASVIPFFKVCGLAREHVRVALSGEGADELFAGYETYAASMFARYYRKTPALVRRGVRRIIDGLPDREAHIPVEEKLKRFVRGVEFPAEMSHLAWREIFSVEQRKSILSSPVFNGGGFVPHVYDELNRGDIPDYLNRLLFIDLRYYLPSDMLVKADRMSMAHGLEIRVPYLDHQVVHLISQMPPELKLKGMTKRKWLLQRCADRILPILPARKKHGFNAPLAKWFRGPLREPLADLLSVENLRNRGVLEPDGVQQILSLHLAGARDCSHELFVLLVFVLWQDNLKEWRLPRAETGPQSWAPPLGFFNSTGTS
jgi:asparagine synthase (glutamine-hydrolysing)